LRATRISLRFYHDDADTYANTADKTEITLCGYDEYHDIAVLKVSDKLPEKPRREVLPTASATVSPIINDSPRAGWQLYALGNMGGGGIQMFDGIMSDPDKILEFDGYSITDPMHFRPVYQVTVNINAGVSGGPVFDNAGKFVGIAAYQMPYGEQRRPVLGVSFAVPAVIAARLNEKAIRADDGKEIHKINMYMTAKDELNFAELGFYVTRTEGLSPTFGNYDPCFSYTVTRLVTASAPPLDLAGEWVCEGDRIHYIAGDGAPMLSWPQIFGSLGRFANESKPVPDGLAAHYSGETLEFTAFRMSSETGNNVFVSYSNKKGIVMRF